MVLEFINSNGILVGGFFSIITALIAAFATHFIERKREKKETIKALQCEVNKLKSELKRLEDQDAADKAIDKSNGSLYIETLPNEKQRTICGFCWEESHKKTPIVPEYYYGHHEQYEACQCPICRRYCRGMDMFAAQQSAYSPIEAENLPF